MRGNNVKVNARAGLNCASGIACLHIRIEIRSSFVLYRKSRAIELMVRRTLDQQCTDFLMASGVIEKMITQQLPIHVCPPGCHCTGML